MAERTYLRVVMLLKVTVCSCHNTRAGYNTVTETSYEIGL